MNHLRVRAAVRLALAALPLSLAAPASLAAQRPLESLWYYTDTEESWTSFQRNADRVTVVAPPGYTIDSLGLMFGGVDPMVMRLARERGVKVMPLIVNERFHQPSLRRLLADSAALARSVEQMVALCRANGYWGLQFDVENLPLEDRERFTRWFTDAATAMHRAGFVLSIAIVHRPEEAVGPLGYHRFLFDSWRGGYDLAAIGKAADFVTIMSYSQHTRRTPPGPQAGMAWTRDVVDHFLRHIPKEKLSLGIATQSMRWYTREDASIPERARSWSEALSHAWALHLAERNGATFTWDDAEKVSWTRYSVGGTYEWIFHEDVRSFQAKLDFARERGLRGFSVWLIGPEDERVWSLLPARTGAAR
jgi:spore germination protein YaaH